MAKKKQSQSKQRSSGAGRPKNSEPQVQVFKQFTGMNIQENQADFDPSGVDFDQSDLQMTYFEIQNNVAVTPMKALETVNAPVAKFLKPPSGYNFTGPMLNDGKYIYAATSGGQLWWTLALNPNGGWHKVAYENSTPSLGSIPQEHDWTWIGVVGGYFVALTATQDIFIKEHDENNPINTLEYHPQIPSPETNQLTIYGDPWVYGRQYALYPRGTLKIKEVTGADETPPDDMPYRIGITYTLCNVFGPTKAAPIKYYWVNHPTTEWSSLCYLAIDHYAKKSEGFNAMEFYYVEGEAQDPAFFYRLEFDLDSDDPRMSFHWDGYNTNTDMWSVANLSVPTSNYTRGVEAQYATSIDGRVYFWGCPQPDRIYIGGNPGNELSVSTGTGGGFADCDPGQGNRIKVVTKYKTQSGNNIVTILVDNVNSQHEYRYNLVENNVSLSSEQSVKGWQTEHVSGGVGCKSPYGAVVAADGLYAVSRFGLALTTLTMEYNSQIRAQYVSDAIEPVFLDQLGHGFSDAVLYEINDILYLAFGKGDSSSNHWLEGIVFCYDIDGKAWWTQTLDTDEPILSIVPLDYEMRREGLLVTCASHSDFVPLTKPDKPDDEKVEFLLQSGCIGTAQPLNGLQNLVQFEFRFDYFCGSMTITLVGIDQLGRKVTTTKRINHEESVYNWAEYMRIDLKLESYTVKFEGTARFRMTHFMAKTFNITNKRGIVWGFDSSQGRHTANDIRVYIKDYNDLKKAIIP